MFTSILLLSLAGLASAAPAPSEKSLVARGEFSGTATYYYQGGNPGSCGDYHSGKSFLPSFILPPPSSPPHFISSFIVRLYHFHSTIRLILFENASSPHPAPRYHLSSRTRSIGADHIDDDFIVAVNAPQQSGSCGKKVKITNTKNGKTATALAADTCKSIPLQFLPSPRPTHLFLPTTHHPSGCAMSLNPHGRHTLLVLIEGTRLTIQAQDASGVRSTCLKVYSRT